jgi:cell division protein FtsA
VARDPYIVAIDIGSSSIKLAVTKEVLSESGKVQVLALVEQESGGIKRGIITNMSEATESLIDIVNQAESIIGLPIKKAVVGVNGSGVNFVNSEGFIVVQGGEGEITENDVNRVSNDSLSKAFGLQNNEILHAIPKSYSVDNQGGIKNPVGMLGNKLNVKTLFISIENSHLRNFTKVFNEAGIEIEDRVFTPLASGDFLLSLRQKKAGTLLIDIGYASTSFIVWENDEILGSGVIPIGSDHITADLAVGLQTNLEMAEEIKKQHLDLSKDWEGEITEVEMFNPDLQINESFKLEEARQYSKARAEEIFLFVFKELRKMGKNSLPGGAYLIGGGSALKGIEDVAKDILKIQIFRYTFDRNQVQFVPDYNDDPTFVNCIALSAYYLYHQDDLNNQRLISHNSSKSGRENKSGGFFGFIRSVLPW